MLKYLAIFFVVRLLLCVYLMRNFHHPDQYWQGPEIAHKIVFGYGFETWEWKTDQPIRSHLFPWVLSHFYRLIKVLGLDETDQIVYAPRLYQAIAGSIFDFFLVKLNNLYNPGTTMLMIFLNYSSWFSLTIMSRMFINSTEAMLTLVAFYLWNIRHQGKHYDLISRLLTIVGFVMRVTSVLFWAVVWPYELFTMKGSLWKRFLFILKNALTLVLMVCSSLLFSYWWYGTWQLVEYNFYYYNIKLKWSDLYGAFPFFSYFYIFLPYILGGHVVYYYKGLTSIFSKASTPQQAKYKRTDSQQKLKAAAQQVAATNGKLKEVVLLTFLIMLVMSTSSHKEGRFLFLLMPLYLLICIRGYRNASRTAIIFSVLINLFFFIEANVYGKEGAFQVLNYIRHENPKNVTGVMFLTQCHLTPYYCVLHRNVPTRFPDCSPLNRISGKQENIRLWRDPDVLYKEMQKSFKGDPSHLIVQKKFQKNFGIDPKKYEKAVEYRHCGLLEQAFMGYDALSVYRRRQLT